MIVSPNPISVNSRLIGDLNPLGRRRCLSVVFEVDTVGEQTLGTNELRFAESGGSGLLIGVNRGDTGSIVVGDVVGFWGVGCSVFLWIVLVAFSAAAIVIISTISTTGAVVGTNPATWSAGPSRIPIPTLFQLLSYSHWQRGPARFLPV